jgi:hypothetical protein
MFSKYKFPYIIFIVHNLAPIDQNFWIRHWQLAGGVIEQGETGKK